MADAPTELERIALQDRDLLQRLSWYFDGLPSRLKQGQGWFIFNAASHRSGRITSFIQRRIGEQQPEVSACVMPWRDFALSAYVQRVGLPDLLPSAEGGDAKVKREVELAKRVSADTLDRLHGADLLVLVGLKPSHLAEAMLLDETLDGRYRRKLATIMLTPDMPQELEAEFELVDPTRTYWDRFFHRMYETSLVAF